MTDENTGYAEEKVFFDTNILVYAVDECNMHKQIIASKLITDAANSKRGVISTQSLQEFFNVAVKKLKLSKEAAKEYVDFFSEQFPVTQVSVPQIQEAIDICIKHGVSFWDSLILSSANDSGCTIVYSEDMNNGQTIEGAKILNPFAN